MSLRTTTTLARQLQPHLRQFSSAHKGSGLRRIRNAGRSSNASTPLSPPASSSTPPLPNQAKAAGETASNPLQVDPHAIANEMVSGSSSSRTSGAEAVASYLTKEQKVANYAMAGGLLAFVSYVFYHSLASVGGADNAKQVIMGSGGKEGDALATNAGFAEFLKEAKEGMEEEEARQAKERKAQGEADKLVELDNTETGGTLSKEEERAMARQAGFDDDDVKPGGEVKRRPMWRRVVFFWKSD